ncbi:MAG: uracil-DNA glycosylase family protein [Bacteroidales bacterium]|nr:uracil-DNA glycosylase family protein [Bacteroidales bacterium]
MTKESGSIEKHPLQPFLPAGARILMLGSFPPARKRWSMEFFYPNWINDMWRIWGLIFFDDKEYFVAEEADGRKVRRFDRDRCAGFAAERGIAIYDTACQVRRLKDNASDKFLEIVEATDLAALLEKIPECRAIVTTGQKATDVIVGMFGCDEPAVGECTVCSIGSGRTVRFWRMPSSSRAYPLPLEKKAEFYRKMFKYELGAVAVN